MSVQKRSFLPPKFANFGKTSKDLFKKKFDFDNSIKSIHKRENVTFESGAVFKPAGGPARGYVKGTFVDPQYQLDAEVHTDAAQDSKVFVKFGKLFKGLTVTAAADSVDGEFKGSNLKVPFYNIEADYVQDFVSTSAQFKTNCHQHKLKASAAVGLDGLSLGGSVGLDVTNGADVSDYNAGIEYTQNTYTASLFTEKKMDIVNLGFFQRVNPGHVVSALFKSDLAGKDPKLQFGSEYVLNAKTSIKGKIDLPSNVVTAAIEHRLADPRLSLGLAASFKPAELLNAVRAQQFGITAQFGDY